MKQYFDLFDKLNDLMAGATDKSATFDFLEANKILSAMNDRAKANPKLKMQIKDVDFYKRAIESIFRPDADPGAKLSFVDQCRQEKESILIFATKHGLI